MDTEERARRRRRQMEGVHKIASGLIRILFIGLLVYFSLKYFAK